MSLRTDEHNRLRTYGPSTLNSVAKTCDQLISMKILPWPARRMLQWFVDDVTAVTSEILSDTV